jgi:hypothetical protein
MLSESECPILAAFCAARVGCDAAKPVNNSIERIAMQIWL